MPELPEVETVVRDLRPLLVGRTIAGVVVGERKLRRPWNEAWGPTLIGRTFTVARRRGKWIVLELDDDRRLVVHLGMTGQFTVADAALARPDHLHLRFDLDGGDAELRYRDIRRFGSVELFPDESSVVEYLGAKLGPEPFNIPAKPFAEAIQGSTRNLKALLLDQGIVAGVGNIYADEALFAAKLHPKSRGRDLTSSQVKKLREAISAVIEKAVQGRGSTIRDYVGGSGLRGEYQHELTAYGRTGEPCLRCGKPITMLRVAGRSSHFCPSCQTTRASGKA